MRGNTEGYYNLVAGSYGLTSGGQSQDIIIAFKTEEALQQFRTSQGWEAGGDANVAAIDVGAGGDLGTTTIRVDRSSGTRSLSPVEKNGFGI